MKESPASNPAGGWPALAASTSKILASKDLRKSVKALFAVNQPTGFDCPGCAWPDPKNPAMAEFCENGVKAVSAETTGKRVTREFFTRHSVTDLREKSDFWLEGQGRLTEPMVYDSPSDSYRPVSWEKAFRLLGDTLKELASPDEAIFYTSGRTSNEAAFLYQLFVRMYGTNNLPDCSNMCHESSGVAMTEALGIGKGTVLLEDFEKADAILILGQNPGTNHPRMLTELQKARRRGAEIITLNPLVEKGLQAFLHPQHPGAMLTNRSSAISSLYLQPLIGGDLAALKGIMKWILLFETERPESVLDHAFIAEHTGNFESFALDLAQTDWAVIEKQSGLSRDELKAVAEIYCRSKAVIACWAMGLTQHKHAVPTIQQVINLLLLRGNIGRPGAGACPVRGHSNVQGDRTMGISEKPSEAFLDRLGSVFAFTPPRRHGVDAVAAIEAMAEGHASVFFAMGGNFARATPDSTFTEAALAKCRLTAHVTTKLNRSHLVHGRQALILPCLGRTEEDLQAGGPQSVTVEDSMSMVHASRGRHRPASPQLLSEPAIIAGLAKATLGESSPVDWDGLIADYARIRDRIAEVIPGFENFNARLQQPGGFYLGNSASRKEWKNEWGRARFTVSTIPDLSLPQGVLRLMTIRSHDQYNTTIYGLNDRYRGIRNERRVIFLNGDDIRLLGLEADQLVDLVSVYDDGQDRRAPEFRVVPYAIPRGCAASYFPETNVLVSVRSVADRSNTPTSKYIPIRIMPREPG
ncbi:MAG TPA: FdhF/YdeP family oxidoreductase [Oceanipulchritudo sp.]|nr:FdhF/YdeP family oxidoreductase [Oceanipulchritudo sp.]